MKFFLLVFFFLSILGDVEAKYRRNQCANLETYRKYLQTAPKKALLKHPNCNQAALKAARSSAKNKMFWIHGIEDLYRKHFGYASYAFRDCVTCQSQSPKNSLSALKKMAQSKEYVFVLSVDGGGIRGLIPAKILLHIEKETGIRIIDMFDIYVGTSTGGLISLFLTTPDDAGRPRYETSELVRLYKFLSTKVFAKSNFLRKIRAKVGLTSTYSVKEYERLLKHYFSNNTMRQTVKPVIVTSVDIVNKVPFLFTSFSRLNPFSDALFMWEAARATSAAPIYFKPFKINLGEEERVLVDGGVGINNPSILGLVAAKKYFPGKKIIMLSLSTETKTKSSTYRSGGAFGGGAISSKKGAFNLRSIIDNLLEVPSANNHFIMEELLKSDQSYYYRVRSSAARSVEMDDISPKSIMKIEHIADDVIKDNLELKRFLVMAKSLLNKTPKRRKSEKIAEKVAYFQKKAGS